MVQGRSIEKSKENPGKLLARAFRAVTGFIALEAVRAVGSFRAAFKAVFLSFRADLSRVSGAEREVACHSQD